jgi:hypothetical protein
MRDFVNRSSQQVRNVRLSGEAMALREPIDTVRVRLSVFGSAQWRNEPCSGQCRKRTPLSGIEVRGTSGKWINLDHRPVGIGLGLYPGRRPGNPARLAPPGRWRAGTRTADRTRGPDVRARLIALLPRRNGSEQQADNAGVAAHGTARTVITVDEHGSS